MRKENAQRIGVFRCLEIDKRDFLVFSPKNNSYKYLDINVLEGNSFHYKNTYLGSIFFIK